MRKLKMYNLPPHKRFVNRDLINFVPQPCMVKSPKKTYSEIYIIVLIALLLTALAIEFVF